MDKKYRAIVKFSSNWSSDDGIGLSFPPFEGCMTWIEDDSAGGPTNLSVKECTNDSLPSDSMFIVVDVRDIQEVK